MRPTDLKFRSPKEKTPDANHPVVTFDGRRLSFSPMARKGTFSTSRRFQQYEIEAKKTGYRVGPGAYEFSSKSTRSKTKGTPVYRGFHGCMDVTNNGYFFSGDQLVFEPSFVLQSRRKNKEIRIDTSQLLEKTYGSGSWGKNTPSKKTIRSTRPTSAKSAYFNNS